MPAACAHDYAALASLALTEAAPSFTEGERRVFLLGAQGPDILYYHGILPPWRSHKPNQIGLQLHAMGAQSLMREMIGHAHTSVERALVLGYLSHWAADAAAHPYVLSRSGEEKNAHGLIEMGADTMLYQERGGQGAPRHMPYLSGIKKEELAQVGALLSKCVCLVLPEARLTARQAANTVRDGDRLYRLFYSPDGKRFRLFRRLETLVGQRTALTAHMPPIAPEIEDPLNLARRAWGVDGRTDTYPELLAQAGQEGARLFALALCHWRGECSLEEAVASMGNRRMDNGEEELL